MARLLSALLAAILALAPIPALAQSSATPVLPGLLTTSGCTSGVTVCYVPYSLSNPLPVTDTGSGGGTVTTTPLTVASTDASGTVTNGGTYQTVFASSATRKGCLIQNPTIATEVLNVRVKSAAVFTLAAGATFSCSAGSGVVISDLIEVTATTTSHAFTAVSQ